ncbi:TetR/AcrR family transcriptional regulator [Thermobifida halotolerans]|uniref:TetR/AcrR family transcriptional regulator n=1 Tax=Thermobifida halotolerans TaxID=483545 RepID=A0A399G6W3_9ACTN|nr:TetR/AcrR family transcriptional regulator [Thermobifida halotolerans]UOE20739.1 TetR/AcrR family transcriptional regulator [Thermobifida halotolerans]
MGRPRQFDEDRVVRAACDEFWAKGFDGTSTEDLCRATGLTRSSLYNTFHSKEYLFRRALSYYVNTMTARQVAVLDTRGSGLERIRSLLAVIVDDEMANRDNGGQSGCFTVNTITTLASRNPNVARIIEADLQRRLSSLRLAVMDGQLDGSVVDDRDPGDLAWYVTSLISGMRIAAQSGADRETLEGIAAVGVRALTP